MNVPSKKTLFTRHGARNGMPIPSSRWLQTALTTKCDEWIACAMNRYLRTCDLYLIYWNATYEFSVRKNTQEKSCKLSLGAKTQFYVDFISPWRVHITHFKKYRHFSRVIHAERWSILHKFLHFARKKNCQKLLFSQAFC